MLDEDTGPQPVYVMISVMDPTFSELLKMLQKKKRRAFKPYAYLFRVTEEAALSASAARN